MNRTTIEELLSHHRRYHNGLQIERFIIAGAGITPFGMYRQALREMHGRWHSLRLEALNLRRLGIEIRELEQKQLPDGDELGSAWGNFQHEKRALDIEEKRMRLEEVQLAHADGVEEFARFALIAEKLHEKFRSLSDEERARLELEFHSESLARDLALEIEAQGRPSANTMRLVGLLPCSQRYVLTAGMQDPALIAEWGRDRGYDEVAIDISPSFVDELKLLIQQGADVPALNGQPRAILE